MKIPSFAVAAVMTAALLCGSASANSITHTVDYGTFRPVISQSSNPEADVQQTQDVFIRDVAFVQEAVQTDTEAVRQAVADVLTSNAEDTAQLRAQMQQLGVDAGKLRIVDEKDIFGDLSAESPVQTTLIVNGLRPGASVIVLFRENTENACWTLLTVGTAPEITVVFSAEGTIAVAIEA